MVHMRKTLTATAVAAALLLTACGSEPYASAQPDNTTRVCEEFRTFEVKYQGAGDSLADFHRTWATDMRKLADQATDEKVAGELRAVAAQSATLAEKVPSTATYDEAEKQAPEVFKAGGEAWVALESRCGKAIIPTP